MKHPERHVPEEIRSSPLGKMSLEILSSEGELPASRDIPAMLMALVSVCRLDMTYRNAEAGQSKRPTSFQSIRTPADLIRYLEGLPDQVQSITSTLEFRRLLDTLNGSLHQRLKSTMATVGPASDQEIREFLTEMLWTSRRRGTDLYSIHSTPPDLAHLLVRLLIPEDAKIDGIASVYDPTCGTGTILSACATRLRAVRPHERIVLHGNEVDEAVLAWCRLMCLLEGYGEPKLEQEDLFGAPPPEYDYAVIAPALFNDLFPHETRPKLSLDVLHHILPGMKSGGRVAMLTSSLDLMLGDCRSQLNQVRQDLIEGDKVESIIQLPEGLTSALGLGSGCLWLITLDKPRDRKGQISLINGARHGSETVHSGRMQELTPEDIDQIVQLHHSNDATSPDVCIHQNSIFKYRILQSPEESRKYTPGHHIPHDLSIEAYRERIERDVDDAQVATGYRVPFGSFMLKSEYDALSRYFQASKTGCSVTYSWTGGKMATWLTAKAELSVPRGRGHEKREVSEEQRSGLGLARALLDTHVRDYKLVAGYSASWSPEQGTVECSVAPRRQEREVNLQDVANLIGMQLDEGAERLRLPEKMPEVNIGNPSFEHRFLADHRTSHPSSGCRTRECPPPGTAPHHGTTLRAHDVLDEAASLGLWTGH